MKYILLLFIALAFAGCAGNDVEINGVATGVTEGTVLLKDASGQTLAGVNIDHGKFHIAKTYLAYSYYGTLTLSEAGKGSKDFELYLEAGQYTVVFDKSKLYNYPRVISKSTIQNQLSAYYALGEEVRNATQEKLQALDEKFKQAVRSPKNWDDSTTAIANRSHTEEAKDVNQQIMMAYVSKYPQNDITAHLMRGMDFEADPAGYYAVYQKFSSSQKNTDEGKIIGVKLKAIIHLVPGAPAPEITGTTPNGKHVDLKAMNKKLILVEFWKAANIGSRENHQVMINNPLPGLQRKEVGMVSVSLDKKRDWWLGSMRDDKLTWTQVSDLKGIESPNMDAWAINDLPTYYLIDGAGRIVERNVPFNQITFTINDYLSHH